MATALVLGVAPRFASAEVFDPLRGYGFDGSPIAKSAAAPARPAAASPPPEAPRPVRVYVSASTIRRMAARSGFRVVDQPYRRGRAFSATGEDAKGQRYRLIFNAFNGQIIDRTALLVPDTKTPAPTNAVAAIAPKPADAAKVADVAKVAEAPKAVAVISPAPPAEPAAAQSAPSIAVAAAPIPPSPVSSPAQTAASASPPAPYSAPTPVYAEAAPAAHMEASAPVHVDAPATVASAPAPIAEAPKVEVSAVMPAKNVAPAQDLVPTKDISPAKVVAAIPAAEAIQHAIPTPAAPPVSYAAVNPCEMMPVAPALKSTALTPAPAMSTAKEIPAVVPLVAALPAVAIAPPVVAPPAVAPPASAAAQPDEPKTIVAKAPPAVMPPAAALEPELKAPDAAQNYNAANINSPPEPYHAPAPAYGESPADLADAGSPKQTGSIPKPESHERGPLEPPSAPTWSEVSGQAATAPKGDKP